MGIFRALVDLMPSPYPSQSENINRVDLLGPDYGILNEVDEHENEVRHGSGAVFGEGEHWTIAAATGAGKTVFNIELLEQYRRKFPHAKRFILDSSGDTQFESIVGASVHDKDTLPPVLSPSLCSIWRPTVDNIHLYNQWLLSILYSREPCIVLLDEIASLSGYSRAVTILEGHMKLLKQGRKHKITVVNSTQEMTRVPTVMFRQMTHFIQMRLGQDITDLSVARRYLGITKEQQREPASEYGGFYKRASVRYPMEEFDSYSHFFKRRKY